MGSAGGRCRLQILRLKVFTMRNRKQSKIENIGHEMHHNTADRSEVDSEVRRF